MMTTKDSDECATESWSRWTWDHRHQHASHSLILIFSSFQDLSWNSSVYRDQLGRLLNCFLITAGSTIKEPPVLLNYQNNPRTAGCDEGTNPKQNTRRFLGGYLAFSKTTFWQQSRRTAGSGYLENIQGTLGWMKETGKDPAVFFLDDYLFEFCKKNKIEKRI